MRRHLITVLCWAGLGSIVGLGLGGCAKPPALPDLTVRASSSGELASFRSDLGERFTAADLQPLDTALQELQLDAMNRGVATADAREQAMRAVVNGKTVHEALILGWQARRRRVLREIALLEGVRDENLRLQEKTAATGTPESVTTHLQNAREILTRLHRDLTDVDTRLASWDQGPALRRGAPSD